MKSVQITERDKNVFFYTIVAGLLIHGFRLANTFYTADSFNYFDSLSATWTAALGRYLLILVENIRGGREVTWLIGLLSVIYMAAAAVLIARIFDIRGKLWMGLTAVVLVANPAVTGTFAHMYTADGYFLGMFLSVLAAYLLLTKKEWYYLPAASIALALSLAFYQAYLQLTIMLLLFRLLQYCMNTEVEWKTIGKETLRFLLMGIVAMGVYLICLSISFRLLDVGMAGYQGVADGSVTIVERLKTGIPDAYIEFVRFLVVRRKLWFYNTANVLWLFLLLAQIIVIIFRRKLYKEPFRIIAVLFIGLIIPVVTHLFCLVANSSAYVSVSLSYSMCTLYLMHFVLYQNYDREVLREPEGFAKWKIYPLQVIQVILLFLICCNFVITAGRSYQAMYLANERMEKLLNRIQMRMELQPGYSEDMDIAVIGDLAKTPEYIDNMPVIASVVTDLYLHTSGEYINGLNWYTSSDYGGCEDEEIRELIQTEEFSEMEKWPSERSVRIIDGVMVLYLSEDSDFGLK